jgi:hypothetical protein
MIEQRWFMQNANAMELVKGQHCLKKSFDVVPLSKELKHTNKVLS